MSALRYCKSRGALIIGITNTVGSTICRESHCGVHINAGPEIGVASTKAYTSQILSLTMFALVMAEDRISLQPRRSEIIQGLKALPDMIRQVLDQDQKVLEIAKKLYEKRSLLIMGRGFNYATCLEGALKVNFYIRFIVKIKLIYSLQARSIGEMELHITLVSSFFYYLA